jgi:4-amino-4-deoxy-L-arabinose transferase-like glycosyltransferase
MTAGAALVQPALPGRRKVRALIPFPELILVIAVAVVLDIWDLPRNGDANPFYAAAVKSMASSWHAFLFVSMDPSGVMTVDKPPLALWLQSLTVRAFGLSSWTLLLPQALAGIASAGVMYDLGRLPRSSTRTGPPNASLNCARGAPRAG